MIDLFRAAPLGGRRPAIKPSTCRLLSLLRNFSRLRYARTADSVLRLGHGQAQSKQAAADRHGGSSPGRPHVKRGLVICFAAFSKTHMNTAGVALGVACGKDAGSDDFQENGAGAALLN